MQVDQIDTKEKRIDRSKVPHPYVVDPDGLTVGRKTGLPSICQENRQVRARLSRIQLTGAAACQRPRLAGRWLRPEERSSWAGS